MEKIDMGRDKSGGGPGGSSRCFALLLDDLPSGPFC